MTPQLPCRLVASNRKYSGKVSTLVVSRHFSAAQALAYAMKSKLPVIALIQSCFVLLKVGGSALVTALKTRRMIRASTSLGPASTAFDPARRHDSAATSASAPLAAWRQTGRGRGSVTTVES